MTSLVYLVSFFSFLSPLLAWSMTLEEKVGQLFIAPLVPTRGEDHEKDWDRLVQEFHIQSALLKASDRVSQERCLKRFKIPLFVLADAEWGLGMRMSDALSFPKNMTLGAIQNLSLLEMLGHEIGREALSVGIHMNLAPVVDVNNNPKNPIIHLRSFGEHSEEVSKRAARITRGMQKAGLFACAKHFPGHGDTATDSHLDLPVLSHSLKHLESIEWPPFKEQIRAGVSAIMTAHILVPALDPLWPATLSPKIVNILRDKFHFDGLILTDALNMKALTSRFTPEEIALRAHGAGADLLLYGDHISSAVDELLRDQIPRAYRALLKAYKTGQFPLSRLEESIRRIERLKQTIQPTKFQPIDWQTALVFKKHLFQEAVTATGKPLIPVDEQASYWCIGTPKIDLLKDHFSGKNSPRIVVALHGLQPNAEQYGLSFETLARLRELCAQKEVILCLFGTPYALSLLPSEATILIGYEEDAQEAVLEVLFGRQPAKGRLYRS